MAQQNIRPYRIDVYGLQDNFLSTLKSTYSNDMGTLQDIQMNLKDDGTQTLSFSIPMYYRENGVMVENPRWKDTQTGLLMENLRKIKVVFNEDELLAKKDNQPYFSTDDGIYEFIINSVSESHKDGILTCNVSCEGLAFNELGRTGYKIELNSDTYEMEYSEALDNNVPKEDLPKANLQYWMDQVVENTRWSYQIKVPDAEANYASPTSGSYSKWYTPKYNLDKSEVWTPVKVHMPLTLKVGQKIGVRLTLKLKDIGEGVVTTNGTVNGGWSGTQYNVWYHLFDNVSVLNFPKNGNYRELTKTKIIEITQDNISRYAGTTFGLTLYCNNWTKGQIQYKQAAVYVLDSSISSVPTYKNDNIIYDDMYVSDWDSNLQPASNVSRKEKERTISVEKSNRYNITQAIAETFGVKCTYQYIYDYSYHIKDRVIQFNADYIDSDGAFDITYPYNTTDITRRKDGGDIVTKLFVTPIEDDTTELGEISIATTPLNKTGEDYILNFDYLYKIGGIDKYQYDSIKTFEKKVAAINKKLIAAQAQYNFASTQFNEMEAKIKNYDIAAQEAKETAEDYANQISALVGDGIEYTRNNPYTAYVIEKDGVKTSKLAKVGVDKSTIQFSLPKDLTGGVDKGTQWRSKVPGLGQVSGTTAMITDIKVDKEETIITWRDHEPWDFGYHDKEKTRKNTEVYFAFKYSPTQSLEELRDEYLAIYENNIAQKNILLNRKNKLSNSLDNYEKTVNDYLDQKNELLAEFERLMGPAMREGYWQPEDYDDYGEQNEISDGILISSSNAESEPMFENELDIYYELGPAKTKTLYHMFQNKLVIKDSKTQEDGLIKKFLDDNKAYNNFCITGGNPWELLDTEPSSYKDWTSGTNYAVGTNVKCDGDYYKLIIQDTKNLWKGKPSQNSYTSWIINKDLEFGYVWCDGLEDKKLKRVLIVTGIDKDVSKLDINPCIREIVPKSGATTTKMMRLTSGVSSTSWFENGHTDDQWHRYYPRIKISNLGLKNADSETKVFINNKQLENYNDYSLMIKEPWVDSKNGKHDGAYYVNLFPSYLVSNNIVLNTPDTTVSISNLKVNYLVTNAGEHIYLDALGVSRENAYPRVSYDIAVAAINAELSKFLYTKLTQVCNVNDYQLQFDHARGYISELNLVLDRPWEDKIVVKNYKTKFEDLFSTIVAQTEAMKVNATSYARAAEAFLPDGTIEPSILNQTFDSANLEMMMNQGKLTISEEDGIWATSDYGVVAMRGGGIYTAHEQAEDGRWLWHTGISPFGISAAAITAGQLNTNLVKVYAGNNVALQLNSDGLFAYKKVIDDSQAVADVKDIDPKTYVVHNDNGLFFHEPVLIDNKIKEIDRVEISWGGIKIRNNTDTEVFSVDSQGNLVVKYAYIKDAFISGNADANHFKIRPMSANINYFTEVKSKLEFLIEYNGHIYPNPKWVIEYRKNGESSYSTFSGQDIHIDDFGRLTVESSLLNGDGEAKIDPEAVCDIRISIQGTQLTDTITVQNYATFESGSIEETITIYKRGTGTVKLPSVMHWNYNFKYDKLFDDCDGSLDGWSLEVPEGSGDIWYCTANLSSNRNIINLNKPDFTTPVKLGKILRIDSIQIEYGFGSKTEQPTSWKSNADGKPSGDYLYAKISFHWNGMDSKKYTVADIVRVTNSNYDNGSLTVSYRLVPDDRDEEKSPWIPILPPYILNSSLYIRFNFIVSGINKASTKLISDWHQEYSGMNRLENTLEMQYWDGPSKRNKLVTMHRSNDNSSTYNAQFVANIENYTNSELWKIFFGNEQYPIEDVADFLNQPFSFSCELKRLTDKSSQALTNENGFRVDIRFLDKDSKYVTSVTMFALKNNDLEKYISKSHWNLWGNSVLRSISSSIDAGTLASIRYIRIAVVNDSQFGMAFRKPMLTIGEAPTTWKDNAVRASTPLLIDEEWYSRINPAILDLSETQKAFEDKYSQAVSIDDTGITIQAIPKDENTNEYLYDTHINASGFYVRRDKKPVVGIQEETMFINRLVFGKMGASVSTSSNVTKIGIFQSPNDDKGIVFMPLV